MLFTGDIIDWRYFAWRYIAGDISSVHPRTNSAIYNTQASNYIRGARGSGAVPRHRTEAPK